MALMTRRSSAASEESYTGIGRSDIILNLELLEKCQSKAGKIELFMIE
jgi:hypothetical protein